MKLWLEYRIVRMLKKKKTEKYGIYRRCLLLQFTDIRRKRTITRR